MTLHNPIVACVRCTRRFRPTNPSIIVCTLCLQTFATTGNAPGEPVPVVQSLAPPSKERDPKRDARLTNYPTPRGICANEMCRSPFTPRYNQRYCSQVCKYTALDRRRRILYGRS